MKIEIEIPDQFFLDILEDAHCHYWADSYTWEGGQITGVIEAETRKRFPLDWPRAVHLVVAAYPHLLDPKQLDGPTADAWVQLAAFGELRYA